MGKEQRAIRGGGDIRSSGIRLPGKKKQLVANSQSRSGGGAPDAYRRRPETMPVAALNTILGRWGTKASPEWNISGEPCSGVAADKSNWDDYRKDPAIKCDCSYENNTVCHITKLRVQGLNVVGQISAELQNFTYIEDLYDVDGIKLDAHKCTGMVLLEG
ncbi:hypothetical protein ABZP36_000067 [Zizania latifolia]